jgi:anti-sigma regulatory factor (Ser/Thr protein kinase)
MSLPKDAALLAAVRLTVAGVALHVGLSLDAIEDLKVIASEACNYCIQRGPQKDGRLNITLEASEERFSIEVRDPSFTTMPAPRIARWTDEDAADELYIIRALAEELEYHIDPKLGLCLRMSMRMVPS